MSLSALGPIMQLAFVPADFDAAIDYWTRVMGVGPFFHLQHLAPPAMWYRGQPTKFDFSIALANWGDVQIELIQQHDDVPSIYTDWRKAGRSGVHHVCQAVESMDFARDACDDAGLEIIQEIAMDGGHAIYVQPEGEMGMMVEIIQSPPALRDLFAMIRAASVGWDGTDPLRVVA